MECLDAHTRQGSISTGLRDERASRGKARLFWPFTRAANEILRHIRQRFQRKWYCNDPTVNDYFGCTDHSHRQWDRGSVLTRNGRMAVQSIKFSMLHLDRMHNAEPKTVQASVTVSYHQQDSPLFNIDTKHTAGTPNGVRLRHCEPRSKWRWRRHPKGSRSVLDSTPNGVFIVTNSISIRSSQNGETTNGVSNHI